MIRLGAFFFRFRNGLFPVFMAVVLVATRPTEALSLGRSGSLWIGFGVAMAVLGEMVRLGTIGFRYIDRGGRDGKVYASRLVTGGIYNHVRNPMYVGNFLIAFGIAVASGSAPALLAAVPFFALAYLSIVAAEEDYLVRSFGAEYEDYRRRVNRFLPEFRGLGRTLSGLTFEWKRSLRKDYGTVMFIALTMIFLPIWRAWHLVSPSAARARVDEALVRAGVASVLYLTVRHLKKSGRLADQHA